MLTREVVLDAIRGGRKSQCLDGRDFSRLTEFFPASDWEVLGFKLKEGVKEDPPKEWTRENVISQMQGDVEFGIEKAEGQRGISSSFMYEVVKMWLWILEDPLADHDDYCGYGLEFFRQVKAQFFADAVPA